ncbi:MAG: glycoside hydrolase family 28 protein [Defluviitaleaceae bacterium]|nr:glycoside hydrolase family 28 protein [Defluviitaleaceae bacterium]
MTKATEETLSKPAYEIRASEAGVILDGSLTTMEGTDCTEALQKIIDRYTPHCSLKLIIDGVALVHNLKLRSNLHIQGLGPHTGFSCNFSDSLFPSAIMNANWTTSWGGNTQIIDQNITVSDMTINGNRENGVSGNPDNKRVNKNGGFLVTARFYGVRNFQFKNVRIIDHGGYAVGAANLDWFAFLDCDFIHTEFMNGNLYPDFGRGHNTDGIHINGPANDGIISNIRIATADDGIALNASDGGRNSTDEGSVDFYKNVFWMGPIKRVVINNVTSYNSWQIIRMLSGRDEVFGTGMVASIDDVTISNINGICANYAVGMEKWPDGGTPEFGKISISHVNVEHRGDGYLHNPIEWNPDGKPDTPWGNWFFIGIGGNCSQIMLSDIKRNSIESTSNAVFVHNGATVKDLTISDLSVCETQPCRKDPGPLIKIGGRFIQGYDGKARVECLTIRNPRWLREEKTEDPLCEVTADGSVGTMMVTGGIGKGIGSLIETTGGTIDELVAVGNSPGNNAPVVRNSGGEIKKATFAATSGIKQHGKVSEIYSDGTGS